MVALISTLLYDKKITINCVNCSSKSHYDKKCIKLYIRRCSKKSAKILLPFIILPMCKSYKSFKREDVSDSAENLHGAYF